MYTANLRVHLFGLYMYSVCYFTIFAIDVRIEIHDGLQYDVRIEIHNGFTQDTFMLTYF